MHVQAPRQPASQSVEIDGTAKKDIDNRTAMIFEVSCCMVAAYWELSSEMLYEILRFSNKHVAAQANALQNIRSACLILRDYLQSRMKKSHFERVIARGHELIAEACLRDLSIWKAVPGITPSGCRADVTKSRRENSKWQEYASTYWKKHYLIAERRNKTFPGLLQRALAVRYSKHFDEVVPAEIPRSRFISQHIMAFCAAQELQTLQQIHESMGIDPNVPACTFCWPQPNRKDFRRSKATVEDKSPLHGDLAMETSASVPYDSIESSDSVALVLRYSGLAKAEVADRPVQDYPRRLLPLSGESGVISRDSR